jgi:hypothetical protein
MMKVLANHFEARREQGFEVCRLSNEKVEVAVGPEPGRK